MSTPAHPTPDRLDSVRLWGHVIEGFQSVNRNLHHRITEAFSLSPAEAEALLRLGHSPGHRLPMAQLAQQLAFSTAGVTKIADRLTERGLVQRSPCVEDRRVTYLELSNQGHTTAGRLHELVAKVTSVTFVDALGPEKASQVAEAMSSLTTVNPA